MTFFMFLEQFVNVSSYNFVDWLDERLFGTLFLRGPVIAPFLGLLFISFVLFIVRKVLWG